MASLDLYSPIHIQRCLLTGHVVQIKGHIGCDYFRNVLLGKLPWIQRLGKMTALYKNSRIQLTFAEK